MLESVLIVLFISLIILIGLIVINLVLDFLDRIASYLSFWFDSKGVIEEPVEEENEFLKGRYNVMAFRERMKEMMDEDGLYDIPEDEDTEAEFTGAEIISNSREVYIDSKLD